MRQQPGDAAIAIGERVDPQQPMMRRGDRHQPLRPPKSLRRAFIEL